MKFVFMAIASILLVAASPQEVDSLLEAGKDAEAFALVQKGAEAGDVEMLSYRAWMYDQGRGVRANTEKAARDYRAAAKLGHNYSRWRLGVLIDSDKVDGTLEEAFQLFQDAADDGYESGYTSLAVMHASGRGTPQNFAAAMDAYKAGARLGDHHGLRGVGLLFYHGQGVKEDHLEAAAWFMVASIAGNERAGDALRDTLGVLVETDFPFVIERANEIGIEFGYIKLETS